MKLVSFTLIISLFICFVFSSFRPLATTIENTRTLDDLGTDTFWHKNINWEDGSVPSTGGGGGNDLNITIDRNITCTAAIIFDNKINLKITNRSTLRIQGNISFMNNFVIDIDDGSVLIIEGDMYVKNNAQGDIDGTLYVSGTLEVESGGSKTLVIVGDGSIIAGEVIAETWKIADNLLNEVRYWVGGSGDWNSTFSWASCSNGTPGKSVPDKRSIVYIDRNQTANFNPTLAVNDTVKKINVLSGSTLNINPGYTMVVKQGINIAGNLRIVSSGPGTNQTGGLIEMVPGTITGSAIFERYITYGKYHYISSPFTAASNNNFLITTWNYTNPNFYSYNEAEPDANRMYGWVPVSAGNFTPGVGYAFYGLEDRGHQFTGTAFNQGPKNYTITKTAGAGGSQSWNLVGNPYPSSITISAFLTANSAFTTQTLWLWDDDGSGGRDSNYTENDYITVNLSGSVLTSKLSENGHKDNGYIAACQGFYVQATSTGTIVFNTTMQTTSNGQFFKNKQAGFPKFWFKILHHESRNANTLLIAMPDSATSGYDIGYDGLKLKGNSTLSFYSLSVENTDEYAIQAVSPQKLNIIPLAYETNKEGDFVIELSDYQNVRFPEFKVLLEDKLSRRYYDIGKLKRYSFTSAAGTFKDRFKLTIINNSQDKFNPSNNTQIKENADIQIFVQEQNAFVSFNAVDVNAQILVYDMAGKLIYNGNTNESLTKINLPNPGFYVITVTNNGVAKTGKVFVR